MQGALDHIRTWVFDLDNTLYPPSANIFPRIDERMGQYIGTLLGVDPAEAKRIQKRYFLDHGTTLSGLMARHQTDPHHFLDYVHDIDMTSIEPDERLGSLIAALPGRKLVYTNSDAPYARKILARLGLDQTFERIYDIHDQIYTPKPAAGSMAKFISDCTIHPPHAAFFDDLARNLKAAKAQGMSTIWINNDSETGSLGADPDDIDFETHHLADWLEQHMEQAL